MSENHLFLNQVFILKNAAISGCSLLLYDYLMTFSSEVEYIWKSPWSIVKAGFLLNRYGNLVGQTLITLGEIGLLGPVSEDFCYGFCLYCTLFMFLSGESVRFVVMMRAWAVWGCNYRMTVWLILLYMVYFTTVISVACYMWRIGGPYPPANGVCLAEIPPNGWLLWFAVLVVDSVALIMVYHSLRRSFMGCRDTSTAPLIRLLMRDAIMFYAASMFNNSFSMICWSIFRQDPRTLLQLVLSLPILTIAGQRLVLNLRRLGTRSYSTSYLSRMVDRELAVLGDA